MDKKISGFKDKYNWLSNFYPVKIGDYPSVENAYQASKELLPENRLQYKNITAGQSKRLGAKAQLIPNWNKKRLRIMEELLRIKFTDPVLRKKLLNTGNSELIEDNYWGDTFWGVCKGIGQNNLGKILMKIRSEIKNNSVMIK